MQSSGSISGKRVQSIDILRGIVMILMAIDHVRVYSGLPAGSADPAIFFTRWITHFCAPAFVFFAGTSAYLYGIKVQTVSKLRRFLLTRGLLLIVLEFTFIKFFWTFRLEYGSFTLAGVIWMLGCSMIFLALIIQWKPVAIGIIGLVIVFGQQIFAFVPSLLPEAMRGNFAKFWEFIYPSGHEAPKGITILYVLVPWIGVMAAGYAFGSILKMETRKRNYWCKLIGFSMILLFLVIGTVVSTRQKQADPMPFLLRLLNQQKYPASQLFLMMTLGPLIAFVPTADRMKGWLARVFIIFGRVPLFYYFLHIPLIHLLALLTNLIRSGHSGSEWYATAPYVFIEPEQRWSIVLLYLIFLVSVLLLYLACSWYLKYKEKNPDKNWLTYI